MSEQQEELSRESVSAPPIWIRKKRVAKGKFTADERCSALFTIPLDEHQPHNTFLQCVMLLLLLRTDLRARLG